MAENTMRERTNPEAVFDFDGTLVHLAKRPISIQNALKYPVNARADAHRFIQGVASTGIDIGPVVSRRPRFGRSFVTHRALRDTGLSRWFDDRSDVLLAGSINPTKFKKSEALKATVMLKRAEKRVTGVVEDKPDKLGKLLLSGLVERNATNEPLVLGVVPSIDAYERTEKLVAHAQSEGWDIAIHEGNEDEMPGYELGRSRGGVDLLVKVVQLDPFNFVSGQQFGHQLQFYAA